MGNIENVQRINQAIDYIHKNLDKNLTAEEIADYCCFSRFYFSRMFRGDRVHMDICIPVVKED